jgi:hypothetical protein
VGYNNFQHINQSRQLSSSDNGQTNLLFNGTISSQTRFPFIKGRGCRIAQINENNTTTPEFKMSI